MAIPPKFAATFLPIAGADVAPAHTVEIYLDYVCPFSAKMSKVVYQSLLPQIQTSAFRSAVRILFRPQIQPWHPSSILTCEAALAVNHLAPGDADVFWRFSAALFDRQKEYFDVNVVNETRNDTYKRLAKLAQVSVGLGEEKVYDLLVIPDKPPANGSLNAGNQVTRDVKRITKAARKVGNHVTPTVYLDGLEDPSISSSWTVEQWMEWLRENVG